MISNLCTFHDNPRAILLDLDDTIITDDAISEKAWRKVCERFAPQFGGISADTLYDGIKDVSKCYWSDHENHRKGRLNLKETRRELVRLTLHNMGFNNQDELAYIISDTYTIEKDAATVLIPGAIETLRYFKDIGLPLALVTNGGSDMQRGKINRFGLNSIFDFILVEGEFGIGKPHPSVFTAAMEKLNVDASHTWMVGDDLERDIAGAQDLGIYSIWIDWRGSGIPLSSVVQPDRIVSSITQLAEE
jgi:putative hydrolase of the HAD superfamily